MKFPFSSHGINGMPSLSLTLQIGIDRNDINKAFIQLTLEFLSKQVRRLNYNLSFLFLCHKCLQFIAYLDTFSFIKYIHLLRAQQIIPFLFCRNSKHMILKVLLLLVTKLRRYDQQFLGAALFIHVVVDVSRYLAS